MSIRGRVVQIALILALVWVLLQVGARQLANLATPGFAPGDVHAHR